MEKHSVVIVKDDTAEIVKEVDVTGYSPRLIEKLMNGISINLDHEHYSVKERGTS